MRLNKNSYIRMIIFFTVDSQQKKKKDLELTVA